MTERPDPLTVWPDDAPEPWSRHPGRGSVWRFLDRNPAFRDGMKRAQAEYDRGELAPFQHRVPRPSRWRRLRRWLRR